MTVAIRVIPCLDVDEGRVVKGVNFQNLRDAGDPVDLAHTYDTQGADELTFLDVTASSGNRETTYDVVRRTAEEVFIPLTVGGGVRTVDDVDRLLRAGADKVGVNTAAIARPELIAEVADRFGAQVLVLSADVRRWRPADPEDVAGNGALSADGHPRPESGFEVTTHGGRRGTGIDALAWCARAADLGAGEILLNSMDADGTKDGYDTALIAAARERVRVPIIASGGAGALEHFAPAVAAGADAVLAASVFHFGELTIGQVKLTNAGLTAFNVVINDQGINAGTQKITNVANGVAPTDAVNVRQLQQMGASINNRIDSVEDNADAGTATAMAVAGLPQAYLPGKSMVSMSGGVYRGQSGYAVGYSTISEGGNWVIKAAASGNSQGYFGGTAGVGYQW